MLQAASRYRLFILAALAILSAVSTFALYGRRAHPSYTYRLPLNNPSMSLESYLETINARVASNPQSFMDWNSLAEVHLALAKRSGDQTEYDEAVKAAQKSLTLMPSPNAGAQAVLAHVLEDQHQFEKAIALAQKILKESPNSMAPYSILATSYLAEGNLAEAQNYADLFVQRVPKIGAMSLRGLVLISAGRDEEGVFDLEKSFVVEDLGEDGDSTWARSILARYYLNHGKFQQATSLLAEALKISPHFPLALDLKAQLLAHLGQTKEAEALFDRAFSQSRQVIYLRHAAELDQMTERAQLAEDRWGQAEKFIRQDLDKALYGHRLELAKICLRRKKGDDLKLAASLVETELQLRQSAETYFLMAQIQMELQQPKTAARFILQALRKGVHEARIYDLAAKIYENLGLKARSDMYRELAEKYDIDFDSQRAFL